MAYLRYRLARLSRHNTRNDIPNGRFGCEIGIAPVQPTELVIFRTVQNPSAAAASEK